MKLVVFIPAHNEAGTIGNVIDKIHEVFVLPEITVNFTDKEVIVLNDSSTDDTEKIALEKGAYVYDILGESKGVGRVIKLGVDHILSHNPDVAVGIDADNQFDPFDIPKLVEPIVKSHADMVTGAKFTDKRNPPVGLTPVKLYVNYIVTTMVNIILKTHFTDVSCGFRAYSREALLHMNLWGDRTYVQEAFLDFFYKGLSIKEVPIKAKYFKERKSRVFRFGGGILQYGFKSLSILVTAMRDYNPIGFFGTIANLCLTVGILLGDFSFGIIW